MPLKGKSADLDSNLKAMLDRFVKAQEMTYAAALAELRAGGKRGHWIWWVFPQMHGLGTSEYSLFYGIADEAEALAYLSHPCPSRRLGSDRMLLLPAHRRHPPRPRVIPAQAESGLTIYRATPSCPFGARPQ